MNTLMTILAVATAMLSAVFFLVIGTVAGAVFYFNQVLPWFRRTFRKTRAWK